MNKIFITLSMIVGLTLGVSAQDIHYSQFYNAPILINPSLTGHIEGTYRLSAIYRNQWSSITSGGVYSTPSGSFDMNFRSGDSRNSFGGGLAIYNDQTGNDHLNTLGFYGSVAYHLSLDKGEKNFLSFGVQAGALRKQVNPNNIIFGDQIDGNGNPTQGTVENFDETDFTATDVRAGVTFSTYPNPSTIIKIGAAVMHLLPVNESFFGNTENNLPLRIVFHGQGDFGMNDKISVLPNFLLMVQGGVNTINLGSNVRYSLSPDMGAWAGAGFRVGDAAIFNLGIDYRSIQVGLAYDFTVSDLNRATNGQGGYEISLGYIGRIVKPADPIYPAVRYF